MIQAIRTAIFISILISSSAFAQRPNKTAALDFFVDITARRTVFYTDENIDFRVARRANKQESPNCHFGSSGTVEVLRSGNVIHTFEAGPVSMLGHGLVRGVPYNSWGWGLGAYNFLHNVSPLQKIEIDQSDNFQFQATCGDEVSEASKPFHISEWLAPVDGLQVFVTPLQKTFKVGEPVRVQVTMRNIGMRSKRCPVPFPDDGYLRSFWALKPHWQDPRPALDDELIYAKRLGTLKPGESRSGVFVLNGFHGTGQNKTRSLGSEPGRYLVWFSVFFEQDDDDVPPKYRKNLWRDQELTTNNFEIVVE
ncbi:MAG: hypothetical protein AABM67_05280 [Acidobacteriota bacterium]